MAILLNGNKEDLATIIECLQEGVENSFDHMNKFKSCLEDGKKMPDQMREGIVKKVELHKEMCDLKERLVDIYTRSLKGTLSFEEAEIGGIYTVTANCLTDEIDNYFNDICDIDHNTEVFGKNHPHYKMEQSDKTYILEMREKCLSLYNKYFA